MSVYVRTRAFRPVIRWLSHKIDRMCARREARMVGRIARARLCIALAGVLGGLAVSSAEAAAGCAVVKGSDEGPRPVCSTGTVVVAERPDAVKAVGTSTITVADGVTARDLRRALSAAD